MGLIFFATDHLEIVVGVNVNKSKSTVFRTIRWIVAALGVPVSGIGFLTAV